METTQLAHELTPTPCINTISDELLLKILAFVPYPGPDVTNATIAMKQHVTLRLVSSRFNTILSMNAFKIEVLRCQYNDVAQLYSVKNIISNTQLVDVADRSAKIDVLVERMVIDNDGNDKVRSMLRLGVRVLDYLKSVNVYSTTKECLTLVVWANDTMFSSQFSASSSLRYCSAPRYLRD